MYQYIDSLKLTEQTAYGNCKTICKKVKEKFPELKLIRGYYRCFVWGKRMHWWLETQEGKIIDPTAIQFPSRGTGIYMPHNDSQPEPTGKCPHCGDYIYDGGYTHKECHDAFVASLSATDCKTICKKVKKKFPELK